MVAPGSDISLHSLGGLWIIPRQPPSSSSRPPEPPPRQPRSVLPSVAQFMAVVDGTVVSMALPSIGRALHLATAGQVFPTASVTAVH
jgi:hypothetical protein